MRDDVCLWGKRNGDNKESSLKFLYSPCILSHCILTQVRNIINVVTGKIVDTIIKITLLVARDDHSVLFINHG